MNFRPFYILVLLLFVSQIGRADAVFLFGGGPRPQAALRDLVQRTAGNILVITWATQEPDLVFESLQKDLKEAGAINILRAPHQIQTADDLLHFHEMLLNASAVFFTGGDQNLALDVIDSFDIRKSLHDAYKAGIVFAGTSAGTALIPEMAMKGGGPHDIPDLRAGLGLVPYFVDQHFIVRDREPRLRKLVLRDQMLGIGVDEGMCALIEDEKLTAMGPTEVQIFIPQSNTNIRKISVTDGKQFVLGK